LCPERKMPRSSRLKAKKEKDLKNSSESCKRIDNYFNPPITSDLVIEKQIIEENILHVSTVAIQIDNNNNIIEEEEEANEKEYCLQLDKINSNNANIDVAELNNKDINAATKYKLLRYTNAVQKNYDFPKDPSKRNLSFQLKWLDTFSWLRYSEIQDGGYCIYCLLFHDRKGRLEHVFANSPFRNWPNALSVLNNHCISVKHLNSVTKADILVSQYENPTNGVEMQLNKALKKQYEIAHSGLLQIAKSIQFCGKLGLPLRGHDDNKIFRKLDEV
jgi:hypothetical protein